jgi:hypothetical protein
MNNNSMGFFLFEAAVNDNFEIKLFDRTSNASLKKVELHSYDHYTEVYYCKQLIYTDKDRQDRFYMGELRSKTTNQSIGKIMTQIGCGKYSVRNHRGDLWVTKDRQRICRFHDGISLDDIDKAEQFKNRKFNELVAKMNEKTKSAP